MKKLLLFIVFSQIYFAQSIENVFTDKISIRTIELYDGKVWYAGTDSRFGYVDLMKPENRKQLKLSERLLQFRTLAQDRNYFYAINVESPSEFFQISKSDLSVKTVYRDTDKNAFYDALHYSNGLFYAFSDPNDDLKLKFLSFNVLNGSFYKKEYGEPAMKKGEAAFAASNTNIASSQKYVWLATGGMASRIFRLNVRTQQFEVFGTPFVQGSASQGIYSIDFFKDKFGIAVGGDYTKQKENINNIATTRDGGKTWQIQASGNNAGYSTCVRIRPGSRGKDIIAIGDQHISLSRDFGKTWAVLSEEQGFYVGEWTDRNNLVLAGNGKIAKMKVF